MAFVSEAERFNEIKCSTFTPGPGYYKRDIVLVSPKDAVVPFGFKVGRKPEANEIGISSVLGFNFKSSIVIHDPDVKSAAFASETQRFTTNNVEIPGPGSYQFPSFTEKLKTKIKENVKNRLIKKPPKYILGSQFSYVSHSSADNIESQIDDAGSQATGMPLDRMLVAVGPGRPLAHEKTTASSRDESLDRKWAREYHKGVKRV